MKKAFKRCAFALVLTLALAVSAFAVQVISGGTCGGEGDGSNLAWTLESEGMFDNNATLRITGTGTMAAYDEFEPAPWNSSRVSIQSVIIGEGVTSIGDYAFYECSNLASATVPESVTSIGAYSFSSCRSLTLTIPENVTRIGEYAFYGCQKLTSAVIPEGVTSIGDFTFSGCYKLATLVIPKSVTSIGDYAFESCRSLESVTIPEGVTSIGYSAFKECEKLASVTLSASVTSIGKSAFYACDSLTSITVDANNAKYASDERGALFDKDKTILIQYPAANTATSYAIPEGVTIIEEHAFCECESLVSVTIPEGVTSIGQFAFFDCNSLVSVIIPEGVTSIQGRTFSGCNSLASVTIPESVTYIGVNAFSSCDSLVSVNIPKGVTDIDTDAFFGCDSLASVTIPDTVTSMGSSAFSGCYNLQSVYITDLAAWCKIAFKDDADSNPLSNGADLYMNGKKATNVVIPNGVTRIGPCAFYGCSSLVTVTVPESVASISESAFEKCGSLTAVTIPESVKSIGGCAFEVCKNLKDVYYTGTEEAWKHILMGSFNDPLENAGIRYNATVLFPSVSQTADGTVYKVSAANLPTSSVVIVALYKDGRFVGYESAVYNGEALDISTQTPHDAAAVMAWTAFDKLIPLAPVAKI